MEIAVEVPSCPLCGSARFRKLATPGNWSDPEVFKPGKDVFGVRRCLQCGLIFTSPRPSPELLNAYYSKEIYANDSGAAQGEFLMSLLSRHGLFPPPKRLLDFGCGGGAILRAARAAGWDVMGFDVSPRAVASCQKSGLQVTPHVEELPKQSFDVIVLSHVFEHIPEHGGLLKLMRELLTARGKLLIEVPNVRSLRARLSWPVLSRHCNFDERFRAFPTHLYYFNTRTLPRMLGKHGFRVDSVETCGFGVEELIRRPQPAFSEALVQPVPRRRATGGWKQLVKSSFFGLGLGENIVAIAGPS